MKAERDKLIEISSQQRIELNKLKKASNHFPTKLNDSFENQ